MKVLGIGGSNRRGGNSSILLERALDGAREAKADIERVDLVDKTIGHCLVCGGCDKAGRCVVQDDALEILEGIWTADAVIFSTPIYFMGPTSRLKTLVDRGQSLWIRTFRQMSAPERRAMPRRPAGLIMVGGENLANMFDPTATIMKAFCVCAGLRLTETLSYKKVDAPGDIRDHGSATDDAYALGKALVDEANK